MMETHNIEVLLSSSRTMYLAATKPAPMTDRIRPSLTVEVRDRVKYTRPFGR